MTHILINDITPRVAYTVGGSAQSAFTVPFPFFEDADLVVYNGLNPLALTTNYTVTGEGLDSGGTVTLNVAVTNTTITIYRDVPIERTTDFPNSGPFQIPALNTQLDEIVAIIQQINARMIHVPASEGDGNYILPSLADRAGKYAAYDSAGDLTAVTAVSAGSLSITATGTALVGAATVAAANNILGTFKTRAEAEAASISASLEYITLSAILSTENAQRSNWKRMTTTGSASNRGHLLSADGTWWQIADAVLYASQFRRAADTTNWAPAIQAMHDFANGNMPGQECRLDAGGPYLIKASTWADRIFTVTGSFHLKGMGAGSKLVWDSTLASTCDIFQIASTVNDFVKINIENVRIEPPSWVEALPDALWTARGAATIYGRDVIRIQPVAGSVYNYIQEMRLTECYFGPTRGFSINSENLTLAQADHFRGFVLAKNYLWGGIRGMIGDSCAARDNRMCGFNTGFDVWQGTGSSVFDCQHNNIFTGNGALRWRGGSRLRFRDNNCEQYGARTNSLGEGSPINGLLHLDNSQYASVGVHPIIEGNYCALVTTGTLFTRIAYIGNAGGLGGLVGFYFASIKHNTFSALTGSLASGTTALVIDADVAYADARNNSYVNGSNGTLLTVDDTGEGTAGIPRAITFSNSWVAHASYTNNNRVVRDNGMVTLTFSVSSGTTASGTVMGNVPLGWRPEALTPFMLSANGTMILGTVGTDGNITLQGTGHATLTYGTVAYIPAKTVFGIGG